MRGLLADFVADSDKEVVCFLAAGDDNSYFLASAADHIVISPVTTLEIPGPVLHLTYFGSALKKLGVGVQGSADGRLQICLRAVCAQPTQPRHTGDGIASLEQNLRSYRVSAIANGRQREESEVSAWLARSIFSAAEAQAHGVIDTFGHRNDVLAALKVKLQVEEHVAYRSYLAAEAESAADGKGGLGLIEALGADIYGRQ